MRGCPLGLLALSLIYMMVSNWDTDKFVKYGHATFPASG
jgi:hypothetical protein